MLLADKIEKDETAYRHATRIGRCEIHDKLYLSTVKEGEHVE